MRRARIESLEERKMFSVTDLIVDPFNTNSALSATMAEPPAIVDFIDPDDGSTPLTVDSRPEPPNLITATYSGDVGLGVVAGNRIGVDLSRASSWTFTDLGPGTYRIGGSNDIPMEELSLNLTTGLATNNGGELIGGSNLIIVICSRAPMDNSLLPYLEQQNYYKSVERLQDIVDGLSNTLMFGTVTFALAVDPSNPKVVYVGSNGFLTTDPQGPTSLLSVDTTTMRDFAGALAASNEYRSNLTASLLGSDEYFSRFTDTTFDDEAAAPLTVDWGDGLPQVTHDKDFETWANVSRFDRGYLSPALVDVLVSGIITGRGDDQIATAVNNKRAFGPAHTSGIPRMLNAGGAAIMAEWTSGRD